MIKEEEKETAFIQKKNVTSKDNWEGTCTQIPYC